MSTEKLAFQPPHAHNTQEKAFLQSLTHKEKELHQLAAQMLGSSYFTGKTHAFRAWEKNKTKK